MERLGWTVALVGGPSGVGKTDAASGLARRYGVALTEVDDLVEALRSLTDARTLPQLHCWPDHPKECARWSPEQIVEQHLAVCRELAPAVHAVVENHLEGGPPLMLEGDYLLPGPLPPGVRAAFLVEADEAQIVRNYLTREPEAGEQTGRARVSWLLGRCWAEEAARHGIPVLAPRPWATLPARFDEALSG